MITFDKVAPSLRMNMASSSPVSVCSSQTFAVQDVSSLATQIGKSQAEHKKRNYTRYRSKYFIPPSYDPLTVMAAEVLVAPEDAGKDVVTPVGVVPEPALVVVVFSVVEVAVLVAPVPV